jgi:hypothetical protein
MPTTTSSPDAQKVLRESYLASLGAGQLVFEKGRKITGDVVVYAQGGRKSLDGTFRSLVKRGEKVEKSVRKSAYTRRAMDQTKVARTQVKAATTSVRKAVSSSAQASKAAAEKVTAKKAS